MAAETNRWEGPSNQDGFLMLSFKPDVRKDCFRWEEKFYACHRCKVKYHKELRVLVVQATGEELKVVEEDDHTDEHEVKAIELDIKKKEPVIESSLNSVVGLTNPGTIKLKGAIQGMSVVVLIEYGAIHNLFLKN